MKSADIALLLPELFRTDLGPRSVLALLLEVMSQLHAPGEQVLDELDRYIDPRRTEDSFVPLLAQWVDLGRLVARSAAGSSPALDTEAISTGNGRLRELVARAAYLSQWRGTRAGLLAFLETATGVVGFKIDERVAGVDGEPRPFHMRVQIPQALSAHKALLERIIEFEKPAYVTCDIEFTSTGT